MDKFAATGVLHSLRQVTEAAVIACHDWVGKGQKETADGAAVDAMRARLNNLPFGVRVVIGEGEKDNAPQLYTGETLGNQGSDLQFDVAVDPVEGTSYMAKGLPDALAVIAMASKDSMMNTGGSYYMDKLVVGKQARGLIEPHWSLAQKLDVLAQALNKNKEDLTVYVLEKPRHTALVAELYTHRVRVLLYPAGDVAGALLAAMPDSPVDALLGTGGTPEAILSAIAVKALGGDFFARFDPQLDAEKQAIAKQGFNTSDWYSINQLVASEEVFFCASGLTDGLMLKGVHKQVNGGFAVHSMLISSRENGIVYVNTTAST